MEDVLPLGYAGGKEIPSYQAYLALAWLRSVEAIRKDGREGYRADLLELPRFGGQLKYWCFYLYPTARESEGSSVPRALGSKSKPPPANGATVAVLLGAPRFAAAAWSFSKCAGGS